MVEALPNAIVIGAQRCGTTQLHRLMEAHEQIYVPTRRKETHYFDLHYDRGEKWYASFFPRDEDAEGYTVIAEATPDYIFTPEAPERIAALNPKCKLVVSLRDPVDRFVSHYHHWQRLQGTDISIERFFETVCEATERGLYFQQLERFLDHFPEDQMHVMVMEEWTEKPREHLNALSAFLGLDHHWTAEEIELLTSERWNAAYSPRFPTVQRYMADAAKKLRMYDLDVFVEQFKKTSLFQALKTPVKKRNLSAPVVERLKNIYQKDIARLEQFLGREITIWPSRQVG